ARDEYALLAGCAKMPPLEYPHGGGQVPKVNVYLPDEMAAKVREAQLSLSPVCQRAIREELDRLQAQRAATEDIEAVATRLRATISEEGAVQEREGFEDGVRWAREWATASELREIVQWSPGDGGDFERPHTIVDYFSSKLGENVVSVGSRPDEGEYAYWDGFVRGAEEVLEKVEPLL
ncbi:MAG: type II toxin-antitoxin system CcdA family antitoxin, partial [Solirubrobacteraceae bacterium]